VLLCALLAVWQLTLLLEAHAHSPALQLWLGRANFAAAGLAAHQAWRFVRFVAAFVYAQEEATAAAAAAHVEPWAVSFPPRPPPQAADGTGGAPATTAAVILLALVTLLTPLVSEAESVVDGHPTTRFGPLFPVYLVQVLGCLFAAVLEAFGARRRARCPLLRAQLALVGAGMLATGAVAVVCNALLPYAFGDFRFCDVGTLSVLLFLFAAARAVFSHQLFGLGDALRRTAVYGLLLAFVLGGYSSTVVLLTEFVTGGGGAAAAALDRLTQFVVLLLAFSLDPLRRLLERKADGLLFGPSGQAVDKPARKRER